MVMAFFYLLNYVFHFDLHNFLIFSIIPNSNGVYFCIFFYKINHKKLVGDLNISAGKSSIGTINDTIEK